MEKKLIERNLKFDQKYIYLEIIRGSVLDGQFTYCENCGKLITNMVKVVNQATKRIYYIGTDCAETLSKAKCLYNNGYSTDFYVDIYSYNKTARFVTELNKGKRYECENDYTCFVQTDKGKRIDCFIGDLKKFFPNYIQFVNSKRNLE